MRERENYENIVLLLHPHVDVPYSLVVMLVSHCGEYPCECENIIIFAANSPDSGEYMASGLTNAIRHQSQ